MQNNAGFVGLLLLITATPMSAADSDQPAYRELTQEVRRKIDTEAASLRPETIRRRLANRYENLNGWLSERAPLPREEESRRVAATVRRIQTENIVPASATIEDVLRKLHAHIPKHMLPVGGQFHVSVVASNEQLIGATGGSDIFVSRGVMGRVGSDASSNSRLAFLLARQIAHVGLGHCRRWHKAEWAGEVLKPNRKPVAKVIGDGLIGRLSGTVFVRPMSTSETLEADLFSIHLCRNAGIDLEACLDVLRCESETPDATKRELALHRLRQLRMEIDGNVVGEQFGIKRLTPAGEWVAVGDAELATASRVVLFTHGLASDLSAFETMVPALDSDIEECDALVVGFVYPSTGSLYRAALFLGNEVRRTGLPCHGTDFVCHSAGGLAFRHLAEVQKLPFRSATLIGTPNNGSDLTSLRPLMEARQFFGNLKPAFDRSVADSVTGEDCQLVRDLEPGSLFLAHLRASSDQTCRPRYRIARGQALNAKKVVLLTLGIAAARSGLSRVAERRSKNSNVGAAAAEWIRDLRIPQEVKSGDLAVTLESATPAEATQVLTVNRSHTKLPDDPDVIEFVRSALIVDPKVIE